MKTYKKPKDIKVGVVGYGGAFNMGKQHLEQMQKAGMTPVAVTELDPERLKVAEEDFPGIETYTSLADMLKKSDVELVTLITPHNTHASLGLQCLRAGRHVVCEKPLAITVAEVDTMIRAAEKSDCLLSTYHNRHWDGCILRAIEQVKRKKVIGKIVRIDCRMGGYGQPKDWWRSSKSISGGIMYDWGVHLLEYSLQLIDSEMTEITGFAHEGLWAPKTRWKKDTNEDEATAIVRFASGQWLSLRLTTIDSNPKKPGVLEITGTKGSYCMNMKEATIKRKDQEDEVIESLPGQQHKYYENVAGALCGKRKLIITPEWSRRPIQALDYAVQSAKKGRALKAKYA